jgi:homospermidine synthase
MGERLLPIFWWGTPERKKPPGRSRRRRKDNLAVYLKEMGIYVAVCSDKWLDCVNTVKNLWFQCSVHNFQANLELFISQE